MFKNLFISIFVVAIVSVSGYAQKNDEAAIRADVAQLVNGWNTKSGEQFAKPFAEDADYVIINGGQIKGRQIIANAHQGIFDTIYKNTNIDLDIRQIRFLKPDVAVVHVFGTAKTPQGDSIRTTNARMTMVMMKTADKWEIIAFQNTEAQSAVGGK